MDTKLKTPLRRTSLVSAVIPVMVTAASAREANYQQEHRGRYRHTMPRSIALTRSSVITAFDEAATEFNIPFRTMLKRRRMPSVDSLQEHDWISTHLAVDASTDAHRDLTREEYVRWLSHASGLTVQNEFSGCFDRMPTVFSGLKNYLTLQHAFRNHADIELRRLNGEIWLLRHRTVDVADPGDALQIFALIEMVHVLRLAAGPDWRPARIMMRPAETSLLSETVELSDAEVLPSAQHYCGIAIPDELAASRPGAGQRPDATRAPSTLAGDRPTTLNDSLKALIMTMMGDGQPKIETVADSIGLSTRSLQRLLTEAGLTYRTVVGQVCFDLARARLTETDQPLHEIAQALGYDASSNFSRAFRRWAGVSPRQYRAIARERTQRG